MARGGSWSEVTLTHKVGKQVAILFLLSRASSVPSLNEMSGSGMIFKQGFSELFLKASGVGLVVTLLTAFVVYF
jgi:hypothetical protein